MVFENLSFVESRRISVGENNRAFAFAIVETKIDNYISRCLNPSSLIKYYSLFCNTMNQFKDRTYTSTLPTLPPTASSSTRQLPAVARSVRHLVDIVTSLHRVDCTYTGTLLYLMKEHCKTLPRVGAVLQTLYLETILTLMGYFLHQSLRQNMNFLMMTWGLMYENWFVIYCKFETCFSTSSVLAMGRNLILIPDDVKEPRKLQLETGTGRPGILLALAQ